MTTFTKAVVLGDSKLISLYPTQDFQNQNGELRDGLGAAALLNKNDDEVHPEFKGNDLQTLCPGIDFTDLSEDAATSAYVWGLQLKALHASDERTLVVLTCGGNDVLSELGLRPTGHITEVDAILERIDAILTRLGELYPNRLVLLGNVYDPLDGVTGVSFLGMEITPEARADFDRLNAGIAKLTEERENIRLLDINGHFRGHGVTSSDLWYFPEMPIEPGVRGASEIRRLALEAIEKEGRGEGRGEVA